LTANITVRPRPLSGAQRGRSGYVIARENWSIAHLRGELCFSARTALQKTQVTGSERAHRRQMPRELCFSDPSGTKSTTHRAGRPARRFTSPASSAPHPPRGRREAEAALRGAVGGRAARAAKNPPLVTRRGRGGAFGAAAAENTPRPSASCRGRGGFAAPRTPDPPSSTQRRYERSSFVATSGGAARPRHHRPASPHPYPSPPSPLKEGGRTAHENITAVS
jgi:hypothetical protein